MEESAFLAAICAAPDDDHLRLVYADWLEEQGREPQATFIRARVVLDGSVPEFGVTAAATLALQNCGYVPCRPELPEGFDLFSWYWKPISETEGEWWHDMHASHYERGFLSLVSMNLDVSIKDPEVFDARLNTLFANTTVQGLIFYDDLAELQAGPLEVFAVRTMHHIRRIELWLYDHHFERSSRPGQMRNQLPVLQALGRSRVMPVLEWLTLIPDHVDDDECLETIATELAAIPFPRLTRFTASRLHKSSDAMATLIRAPWFQQLEHLNVNGLHPGLAGPITMPRLHTLGLCHAGPEWYRTLVQNAYLPALKRLSIFDTSKGYTWPLISANLAESAWPAILAEWNCPDLVELHLGCFPGNTSLKQLLATPWARRLELLRISLISDEDSITEVEAIIDAAPCADTLIVCQLKDVRRA